MNVADALFRARALMDEHGLSDWALGTSKRMKGRTLGITALADHKIVLSLVHIELNDWAYVEPVVLHEIAHALAHNRHGSAIKAHGAEWRSVAAEVGLKQIGYRLSGHVSPERRYRGVCPCGTPHSRQRMASGSTYTCNVCNGHIVWTDTKTGKELP